MVNGVLQYNPYTGRTVNYPRPLLIKVTPDTTTSSVSNIDSYSPVGASTNNNDSASSLDSRRNLANEMNKEVIQIKSNSLKSHADKFQVTNNSLTLDRPVIADTTTPSYHCVKRSYNTETVPCHLNDLDSSRNIYSNTFKKQRTDVAENEDVSSSSSTNYKNNPREDNDFTLSRPRYVAVDVETHDCVKYTCRDDYTGRIVQIGWISYNCHGKVLDKQCHYIRPPVGFQISTLATQCHGITNEIALRLGKDATVVLQQFVNVLQEMKQGGGYVIAHNMKHEDCCLAHNMTPTQLQVWDSMPKVCTFTPRLLHLIDSDQYWSAPGLPRHQGMKLVDLHRWMCGDKVSETLLQKQAHNALADAQMAAEIFFEFKRQVPKEEELLWQKNIALGYKTRQP